MEKNGVEKKGRTIVLLKKKTPDAAKWVEWLERNCQSSAGPRCSLVGMRKMYDVFNAICVGDLGFNVSIFPTVQFDPALKDRVLKEIVSPENYQKTPSNLLLRIPFKYRRWKENGWKHSLCFNDSMISAFWSGVKSHLLKPSSI